MPHQGRNVKRIREILGIKQDALAIDLGLSQQAISQLEQRETLDAPTLEKVAKALGVSEDAIKNYNDEATVSFISNTFSGDNNVGYSINRDCRFDFNPIDKIVELYEALVKSEKDKVAMLERLLEKK